MRVLFAVVDEKISNAVIDRYQKEYNTDITYKNVYFFNAVVKELERDQNYDAIVIDELLETVANDDSDLRLLGSLQTISEVAINANNARIPIILILKAKRQYGEGFLSKIYSFGILNALIGKERKISKICELLAKQRTKAEAQEYYQISVKDDFKQDNNEVVPANELQNIINYYRKNLGTPENFSSIFDKIKNQYSDYELLFIADNLDPKVVEVLKNENAKYAELMANKEAILSQAPAKKNSIVEERTDNNILVPQNKVSEQVKVSEPVKNVAEEVEIKKPEVVIPEVKEEPKQVEFNIDMDSHLEEEAKKESLGHDQIEAEVTVEPKKLEPIKAENVEIVAPIRIEPKAKVEEHEFNEVQDDQNININPTPTPNMSNNGYNNDSNMNQNLNLNQNINTYENPNNVIESVYINNMMNEFKNTKCAIFVGTSKNGVSFTVNSLGMLFSSIGINTAILDLTKNRNDYYIATSNEEDLRNIATESINNLRHGIANGIQVERNLTVYTGMPNSSENFSDAENIMPTLYKNHSLILIDADFDTPHEYFKLANEIFAIQSLDVLTIQPLTQFLRDLKRKNILTDDKIRVIINKELPVKGLNKKLIVEGLSTYNSPSMSSIEKLFNRNTVKVFSIEFDMNVYQKYMENIVYCKFEIVGYPRKTIEQLKIIANDIIPHIN